MHAISNLELRIFAENQVASLVMLVLLVTLLLQLTSYLQLSIADRYFALCAIVKNEVDVEEWIEHHRALGCSKFYIFDGNSSNPSLPSHHAYVSSGLVNYTLESSGSDRGYSAVYDDCLKNHARDHRFIGFLDVDEYIVVADKSKNIQTVLRRYEAHGGLVLSWKILGSSGHVRRPSGGVVANYHKCFPDYHVKSIVNTNYTLHALNPHIFAYKSGHFAVDTQFNRVDTVIHDAGTRNVPLHAYDVMYVHHYSTKSTEDYVRRAELQAGGRRSGAGVPLDNFYRIQNKSVYDCHALSQPPPPKVEPRNYFAMCAIVKDEPDLAEWVEYHRRLGCSKFYIFDHNSTTPALDAIRQYVSTGLVDYHFTSFHDTPVPQLALYEQCLRTYGPKHQWLGFQDVDEYIVVVNKTAKIPDVLRRYERYGGLVLNWKFFGSSGHVKRPAGGVLANYRMCMDGHLYVKSIVNTQFAIRPAGNPHIFLYDDCHYAVDTHYARVNHPIHNFTSKVVPPRAFETMYINHYNTRSLTDYLGKKRRGNADRTRGPADPLEYFYRIQNKSTVDCGILNMPAE